MRKYERYGYKKSFITTNKTEKTPNAVGISDYKTKNYSSIMKQEGVLDIIKFGVAFYKKQIKILSQIEKP